MSVAMISTPPGDTVMFCSPAIRHLLVCLMLTTQAGLLAYSASRHGPTLDEPALLVSGLSHWEFSRFELYRVNPPLIRTVAALPILLLGYEADWSQFREGPGSRAEFRLGDDFLRANGTDAIPLFMYARWACIPFNLIGAYFAYRWSMELYRSALAGLATLILYVFEPSLLAHGELITCDGACTAFGILAGYTFWRWLKHPAWMRAILAGASLGLAELSKMSWLILFGLWPLLWLLWRCAEVIGPEKQTSGETRHFRAVSVTRGYRDRIPTRLVESTQLATILFLAIYSINLGYCFDGFGTPLKEFQFVSTTLTGLREAGAPGNRFQQSWLGRVRLPLPKQYIVGFDSQTRDLEKYDQKSYLLGEWKDGGWWYYYLYGLLVKVPCGTWGLFLLVILGRLFCAHRPVPLRDEFVLIAPALALLVIVSSQTTFNIHLRYVFPALGLFLVFLGQAFSSSLHSRPRRGMLFATLLIGYSVLSATFVYPNHLAYFNDFVGGPKYGYRHLLGSSMDWGQDSYDVAQWLQQEGSMCDITFDTRAEVVCRAIMTRRASIYHAALDSCNLRVVSADRFHTEQYDAREWIPLKVFPSGCAVVALRNHAEPELIFAE